MTENNVSPQMKMDAIDAQRENLSKKTVNSVKHNFDEKNYLNLTLKKGETIKKVRIRVLNITPSSNTPFMVIKTHSLMVDKEISRSGFKTYVCLNDEHLTEHENKGCPICNESQRLYKEAKNCDDKAQQKTLFKSSMSLSKKDTFIMRVIDRDHEDEGVKFWRFNAHSDGTGCYDKLMNIYDARKQESIEAGLEPYNVFDLKNGRDFIITVQKSENSDKTTIDIVDAGFPTPLSQNNEQAMSWINDTKSWNDIYGVKTYSYLDVVINGGIPVFNKELQKFIPKTENEDIKKKAVEEASKVLLETSVDTSKYDKVLTEVFSNTTVENNEDDDYPF